MLSASRRGQGCLEHFSLQGTPARHSQDAAWLSRPSASDRAAAGTETGWTAPGSRSVPSRHSKASSSCAAHTGVRGEREHELISALVVAFKDIL